MKIELRLFNSLREYDMNAFSLNRDAVDELECHIAAMSAQNRMSIGGSRVMLRGTIGDEAFVGRLEKMRIKEFFPRLSMDMDTSPFLNGDLGSRVAHRCVDVVVDIRAHVGLIESNCSCLVGDTRLQFTVHFTED